MITAMQHFSRLAATLVLTFAMTAVALAQVPHTAAGAAEPPSIEVSMACEKAGGPAAACMADASHDHGPSGKDRCCGGAVCAVYTLQGVNGGPTPVRQPLSFAQSPVDALRVAEISLPKRPPRFL